MDELRNRLLGMLARLRLSDDEHAEYVDEILAATTREELGVIVAEFMDVCGDHLDALAIGLEAGGSITEAGRMRAEAARAHADLDALALTTEPH